MRKWLGRVAGFADASRVRSSGPAWRDAGVLGVIFVVSRCIYFLFLGVRFNVRPLDDFVQYLDPQLLRTDLVRSVWYMHFQPPAFNLFLGVVLKLFPGHFSIAFQAIYLAMGLGLGVVLWRLLLAMGVGRKIALALAAIHMILPSTVLYENWLFYSYPLALLLCGSAYALALFLERYRVRHGLLFFGLLAVISSIHAMFGLAWMIAILAGLLIVSPGVVVEKRGERNGKGCNEERTFPWPRLSSTGPGRDKRFRGRRWRVVLCAVPAVGLLVLMAVKQFVLFGTFTTGAAYLGPNLAVRVGGQVPQSDWKELVDSGVVPRFFFEKPLQPIGAFRGALPKISRTGIAALDEEFKSTGAANFNHIGFLAVGDADWHGALAVMKKYPLAYPRSFVPALRYFGPTADDYYARQSGEGPVIFLLEAEDLVGAGQISAGGPGWLLVIGLPLLVIFGCGKIWRAWRAGDVEGRTIVLGFMVFNIVYSAVLTVALTWGDWNRYRFSMDVFFVVLLGMWLSGVGGWRRRLMKEGDARGG